MGSSDMIAFIALMTGIVTAMGVGGWVFTTWLRVKNGYPLEGENGQMVYPGASSEEMERVKLLTTENARLRAEVGSVKDRLAVVERIVTDRSFSLDHEIERLRN